MTALTPPPGVDERRSPIEGCVAEWIIETQPGAWLRFRLHGPAPADVTRGGKVRSAGRPPRVEIRTGVSSYGPDITDPDQLRRLGWALLSSCHAMAEALDLGRPEPEPDPQLTIDDALAEAGT